MDANRAGSTTGYDYGSIATEEPLLNGGLQLGSLAGPKPLQSGDPSPKTPPLELDTFTVGTSTPLTIDTHLGIQQPASGTVYPDPYSATKINGAALQALQLDKVDTSEGGESPEKRRARVRLLVMFLVTIVLGPANFVLYKLCYQVCVVQPGALNACRARSRSRLRGTLASCSAPPRCTLF